MDQDRAALGRELRKRREALHIGREKAAAGSGICISTLRNIEKGRTRPDPVTKYEAWLAAQPMPKGQGEDLRRLRVALGLYQSDIAHASGLSRYTVGNIERDQAHMFGEDAVRAYCMALDLLGQTKLGYAEPS
jgi:transcriptional regulator with XRE-family HTH domain